MGVKEKANEYLIDALKEAKRCIICEEKSKLTMRIVRKDKDDAHAFMFVACRCGYSGKFISIIRANNERITEQDYDDAIDKWNSRV